MGDDDDDDDDPRTKISRIDRNHLPSAVEFVYEFETKKETRLVTIRVSIINSRMRPGKK